MRYLFFTNIWIVKLLMSIIDENLSVKKTPLCFEEEFYYFI